jgi:DUF438 domain-containing protein
MDDANAKLLAELGVKLTESAVRNTAGAISDKISSIKAKRDDKQTIRELEDIVNNLLDDKSELVRIAQAYEQELVSQKISDEDITYITDTLVPLIEKFVGGIEDGAERAKNQAYLDTIKSVVSKEMITVMQLVGFNFKQAVGEPLTLLIRRLIESKMPINDAELKRLNVINSNLSIEVAKDEAATNRLMKLLGRE